MSSNKVTKIDLIEAVYQATKCDKQVVQKVTNQLFEQIKVSLSEGKNIELRGLGTFKRKVRKGRKNARNPKNGEIVSYESYNTIVFDPGQELDQALRELPVTENKDITDNNSKAD